MKKFQSISHQFLTNKKQTPLLMAFLTAFFAFGVFAGAKESSASSQHKLFSGQAAQSAITGEWTAEFKPGESGKITVTFFRRSRGNVWTEKFTPSSGELQSFGLDGTTSAKTNVNFRIAREAGTFECEGYFREGRGAGFWTFIPSQDFITAIGRRGYDNLSEDNLFAAAIGNVTVKLIEDLKSFGYNRLSFEQLFQAGAFNLTREFIGAWRTAGFKELSFERLAQLGAFKVTPEYLNEIKAAGYENPTLEEVIQARTFGVTPNFIQSWRAAGFKDIALQEITELATFKVTPEFLNEIKAEGFPQISPRQSVQLKIHGINRDFIRRVRARGFPNVTLSELVELRVNNIVK